MSIDLDSGRMPYGKGRRARFLVLLAITTPGIPEYLTGSWKLSTLGSNPLGFSFFLAMNIGLYTMVALLIREFAVAYSKGWVSIFILGCAYGIMEEAIALHTFFQISGSPVGFLGTYGRYAGVDWVWAFGLMVYHAVFSITLPLMLVSAAYPRLKGKRVTGTGGSVASGVIYAFTVLILNYVVNHTSTRPVPTPFDYLLFLFIPLLLVLIAYLVPRNLLQFRGKAGAGGAPLYVLGLLVYPVYNVFAILPVNPVIITKLSPILDILIHAALFLAIGFGIVHYMPREENSRQKVALGAGVLTSLMVVSLKEEFTRAAPLIIIVIVISLVFLFRLRTIVKQPEIEIHERVTQTE